jgi:hypothetical protein
LQPYHTPSQHRRGDPLLVLDHFAAVGRHRTLHQSFAWTNPKTIRSLFVPQRRAEIVGFRTLIRSGQALLEGTKIARLRIKPTARQPKVDVQGDLLIDLAFGDRRDLFVALEALYALNKRVRQYIAALERFL